MITVDYNKLTPPQKTELRSKKYCEHITKIYFKEAPKKKFEKKKFKSEVRAAFDYGCLNLCINVLKDIGAGKYENIDEVAGDLMIILQNSYEATRRNLNVKAFPLNMEEVIERFENVKREKGELLQ